MTQDLFLPGVPVEHVRERPAAAGGDEIGSRKIFHPESSAELAVNAFGWFIERPMEFPPLPGTAAMGMPERVEVEYCARFPWSGGRHPWLDAAVVTPTHLIGVESKRFEPFRDVKNVSLSAAYDQPVWGERMGRFAAMRDALRAGGHRFRHLDAAQLVKHAFGLTDEQRAASRGSGRGWLFTFRFIFPGGLPSARPVVCLRKPFPRSGLGVAGPRSRRSHSAAESLPPAYRQKQRA